MEKDTVIKIAVSAVLAAYLVFALVTTRAAGNADHYRSVDIAVADPMGSGFVSEGDIAAECGDLASLIASTPCCSLSLGELEERITAMPVVEDANVATLCNGTLRIDVKPMVPVARVFNPKGDSYYINASGKRVPADARYHVDVPVVVGAFGPQSPRPEELLPLLSHIAADPTLDALVSTVALSPSGDIVIVPAIRGQVINFGDTRDIADKFDRLKAFYRSVLPVRGWDTYDTVSVKWAGRVVASHRDKSLGRLGLSAEDSDFGFIDDLSTMSVDGPEPSSDPNANSQTPDIQ